MSAGPDLVLVFEYKVLSFIWLLLVVGNEIFFHCEGICVLWKIVFTVIIKLLRSIPSPNEKCFVVPPTVKKKKRKKVQREKLISPLSPQT